MRLPAIRVMLVSALALQTPGCMTLTVMKKAEPHDAYHPPASRVVTMESATRSDLEIALCVLVRVRDSSQPAAVYTLPVPYPPRMGDGAIWPNHGEAPREYLVEAEPGCRAHATPLAFVDAPDDTAPIALPEGMDEAVYAIVAPESPTTLGYASRELLPIVRYSEVGDRVRFNYFRSSLYRYRTRQWLWYALVPFTAVVEAPLLVPIGVVYILTCGTGRARNDCFL
jgi:hypothetical protein